MRAHLQKYFARASEHHLQKSRFHMKMSAHLRRCSKAEGMEEEEEHFDALLPALASEHEGMGREHASMAEDCLALAKHFGKMSDAEFAKSAMVNENELEPLPKNFTFCPPSMPRLVARAGGPPLPEAQTDGLVEKVFGGVRSE